MWSFTTNYVISKVLSNLDIPVRQKLFLSWPDISLQFTFSITKPSLAHLLVILIPKHYSFCMKISFFKNIRDSSLSVFRFYFLTDWWIYLLVTSLAQNPTLSHFCLIVPPRWKYLILANTGYRNRRITFASLMSCPDSEMGITACLDVIEVTAQWLCRLPMSFSTVAWAESCLQL